MEKIKTIYFNILDKAKNINLYYKHISIFCFLLILCLIFFNFKGCSEIHQINKTNKELININKNLSVSNDSLKEKIIDSDNNIKLIKLKIDSLLFENIKLQKEKNKIEHKRNEKNNSIDNSNINQLHKFFSNIKT